LNIIYNSKYVYLQYIQTYSLRVNLLHPLTKRAFFRH
jgi:hypothetical protein